MTRGAWRSLRFSQLFAVTVLALLLVPLQLRFRALWLISSAVYLDAVLVALSTARQRGRLRAVFLAGWLAAPALRFAFTVEPGTTTAIYAISRMLVAAILGGCVVVMLQYVLRSAEPSLDRIFAAIVAYLLAGLGFAAAYEAVIALAPQSFAIAASDTPWSDLEHREVQLIYFSFVTLATLGYGDITPRLPFAQMLAVVEAVAGQFYIAVVIAWLVSAHAGQRTRDGG